MRFRVLLKGVKNEERKKERKKVFIVGFEGSSLLFLLLNR